MGDHTIFNGLCVWLFAMPFGEETHRHRFVLEIMFVLVIATIMTEIIAEKV